MIPGKYSGLVTCFAASGMGMFVAIWLLDFSLVRVHWCSGVETICFRDWLGALSGWMAAIGALFAAWLTIRKLREQIAEQKRQTNFIIGEAEPDFIIERNRRTQICTLKVINWNRHRIIIENIIMNDNGYNIVCYANDQDEQCVAFKNFKIDGWLNRNEQPPQRDITVDIIPTPQFPEFPFNQIIELSIDYRVISQNQIRGVANATAIEII